MTPSNMPHHRFKPGDNVTFGSDSIRGVILEQTHVSMLDDFISRAYKIKGEVDGKVTTVLESEIEDDDDERDEIYEEEAAAERTEVRDEEERLDQSRENLKDL